MLGYGSQGTLVFEGSLHGRSVAVKRMLRHLYHLAKKEIDALILSDEVWPALMDHPHAYSTVSGPVCCVA